jgi:hypothetical protein
VVVVNLYAYSAITTVERTRRSNYLACIAVGKHFLTLISSLLNRGLLELAKAKELFPSVLFFD